MSYYPDKICQCGRTMSYDPYFSAYICRQCGRREETASPGQPAPPPVRLHLDIVISVDSEFNVDVENIKVSPVMDETAGVISAETKLTPKSVEYGYLRFPAKSELGGAMNIGQTYKLKLKNADKTIKAVYRRPGRFDGMTRLYGQREFVQAKGNQMTLRLHPSLKLIEVELHE
ncbi:MAG: hypothetical protein GXY05_03480 [Clostridiales bacterium]|nr:hypothetical protein [Clostridiales bacterium]